MPGVDKAPRRLIVLASSQESPDLIVREQQGRKRRFRFQVDSKHTDGPGTEPLLHPDRPAKHLHHILRVKGSRSKRNTQPGYPLHPSFRDAIRRNVTIACFFSFFPVLRRVCTSLCNDGTKVE